MGFRDCAHFVKGFIPTSQEHDRFLRAYAEKGARLADYEKDEPTNKVCAALRLALAESAALHVPDSDVVADPASSRPFELYAGAGIFARGCFLAPRAEKGGPPRPVSVFNRA